MNRGSGLDWRHDEIRIRGFNEAPIHESGKSVHDVVREHTKYGFNEAPIHESGKLSLAV